MPTVITVAIYFCFADLVLVGQCVYYNHVNSAVVYRRSLAVRAPSDLEDAEQPLLSRTTTESMGLPGSRRRTSTSWRSGSSGNGPRPRPDSLSSMSDMKPSRLRVVVKNVAGVVLICATGTAAWLLAWETGAWTPTPEAGGGGSSKDVALGPQVLGFLSALCYLGYAISTLSKVMANYH